MTNAPHFAYLEKLWRRVWSSNCHSPLVCQECFLYDKAHLPHLQAQNLYYTNNLDMMQLKMALTGKTGVSLISLNSFWMADMQHAKASTSCFSARSDNSQVLDKASTLTHTMISCIGLKRFIKSKSSEHEQLQHIPGPAEASSISEGRVCCATTLLAQGLFYTSTCRNLYAWSPHTEVVCQGYFLTLADTSRAFPRCPSCTS